MNLRNCERLSAVINETACKTNQKRGVSACEGCPGLKGSVEIKMEETMAKNPVCIQPGCEATRWNGGYCWKHHPDHEANKKALVTEAGDRLSKLAKIIPEIIPAPEPLPPVTDHEIHVINLLDVFKAKQAAELAAFADRLSEISDPVEKLLFVYNAVNI